MESLIEFLKRTWVGFVSAAIGIYVFLRLYLPFEGWVETGGAFACLVIIIPLVLQAFYVSNYRVIADMGKSFVPIRFGCVTFIIGLILWNNLPLEGVSGWVKFILGAILFVGFPFLVQYTFGSRDDEKKE